VSLLDTACARVAISQHAVPPEVDDTRKRIEALDNELAIIGRETAVGVENADREAAARAKLDAEKTKLKDLEDRWNAEKALVEKILDIRGKLRAGSGKVEGTASALEAAADAAAKAATPPTAATAAATMPESERKVLLEQLRELRDSCTSCRATAR
jgi:type VI secretion system protein VasG